MAIGTLMWRSGEVDETVTDCSPAAEMLQEMAELLRDARPGVLVSGFTVAAVTVGTAVEELVLPVSLHAGAGAIALRLGLLAILVVSLVRTAVLTITAGRPLLDQLGELRRQTGAPVDPTVPWTPRTRVAMPQAPSWDRMRAVLAAAHFHTARAQLAMTWATLALMGFTAWTLVTLIVAGRI